jgi:hypothetical protein
MTPTTNIRQCRCLAARWSCAKRSHRTNGTWSSIRIFAGTLRRRREARVAMCKTKPPRKWIESNELLRRGLTLISGCDCGGDVPRERSRPATVSAAIGCPEMSAFVRLRARMQNEAKPSSWSLSVVVPRRLRAQCNPRNRRYNRADVQRAIHAAGLSCPGDGAARGWAAR